MLQRSKELLGTTVTVSIKAERSSYVEACIERAFGECQRIEAAFSRFIAGNELDLLNLGVGQWVPVSEELYGLISYALEVKKKTLGAFDISVKSVLTSWGYDREYSFREGEKGSLGTIETSNGKVRIASEIDLGGLGKGYAVDRMVELLDGFETFSVNAGGDIYSKGGFKTAFEHPLELDKAIGVVEVDGFAVASSSGNRRKWRDRHHLVDPFTLRPAAEMLAVYTQAERAIDADAYATALFVLGFERAKALLKTLPVDAMLISPRGEIFKSAGFKGELFLEL
ncbi:FAD:protein FMN transferase [Candidatus Peregrinibacteria bacterium]|nr:FAD:protein FMN transferase [Candidatus Peregrinibacteria bacterium]